MRSPPTRCPEAAHSPPRRRLYLCILVWSFGLFNTLRVLAYLPTIWAIYASGDSQQHSWFTWLTWAGANATMAAWLYEDARRWTRAVAVNSCNALMCFATLVLIVALRM